MELSQQLAERLLLAARRGSSEALGELLENCRRYLLTIARRELDPDLNGKGSASDLVQDTFLEAQRDFNQFDGTDDAALCHWLRQLLLNNLKNFRRHYRAAKRRSDLEVSFTGEDNSKTVV